MDFRGTNLSGINTEVFTGHSTRSASTSKAKASGVSSNDIIKRVYWTQTSTFEKFTKKKSFQKGKNFNLMY